LGHKPVGIGFKALANEYAADLTPALAVVLTAIYGVLKQANQRFLIVVDEASYLTSNPDAGQVLEQIMRRGRKAGAGVWMASQKLEDFLDTPLGKTLASVSSTKWILGCQENTLNEVAEAFGLSAEEKSALNPIVKGRGVLLSDSGERAVAQLIASDQLLSIVTSSPSVVGG
jgi:type IV secretory pathway VirB4 component